MTTNEGELVGTTLRVEVQVGNDPLRIDQLTRHLLDTLSTDGDVARAGLTIQPATRPAVKGSKGTLEPIIALLVAGAPYAQPAADVLTAAIQRWCARDRRAKVLINDGERRIEIRGELTDADREVIDEFWRRGRES